jgi:hypothetical protein
MLDVHPPHHPTHTWTDFFIHIATICIGLLIAIGLEQTVEAFHRAHERHVLIEDLHAECENNIQVIASDIVEAKNRIDWDEASITVLRTAPVTGGQITASLPQREKVAAATAPSRAVWAVAKSSGKVALLPENLAEVFDRLDHEAEENMRSRELRTHAQERVRDLGAVIGAPIKPGQLLHITVAQRDLILDALATELGATQQSAVWLAYHKGASEAVLNGVTSRGAMDPYLFKARDALHIEMY